LILPSATIKQHQCTELQQAKAAGPQADGKSDAVGIRSGAPEQESAGGEERQPADGGAEAADRRGHH
jgi:hypothetical protein